MKVDVLLLQDLAKRLAGQEEAARLGARLHVHDPTVDELEAFVDALTDDDAALHVTTAARRWPDGVAPRAGVFAPTSSYTRGVHGRRVLRRRFSQ